MDGIQLIAPDYRDYVMNNIVKGYDKPYEVMGLRKNGEEYPLRLQGKNIPYKGQQVRTVEFRDITEQKLEEAALIKEKEAALESNRLKSEFIANLSHEIRTPMNGILGFADLLKEPTLSQDEQFEYIDIIEKSGARMLNIINGIIDISKIEAGSMKTNISKFNIKNQLSFIYDFFKPEADLKNLGFTMADLSVLAGIELRSDQEKVNAILVNLVKNAIKFTEKGQVEFGVVKKDNLLEFFVKDTGIGISPQRQKSIFDRFNQDLKEDQKIPQGAGLGLSITKAYIEMLGGTIWLSSEFGEGTTFFFTLPLDITSLKEDSNTKEQSNVFNIADLTDLTIMIAEDDETSELLLKTYLKPHAKKILSAKNGVEAVEIAKNNPDIDLIMMDIQMPLMNGFLATEKIRTFNSKFVIIAQTAFGLSGDRDKALEAGCNDYIAKPIKKEELKTMIRKYFL
jgi:signal transduction histidine kinase/CheY-like chemotaxis protein